MNDAQSPTTPWTRIDALVADTESLGEQLAATTPWDHASRRALAWGSAGAACFGAALGSYGGSFTQILLAALKVPMLLLGTALLCFPAFYVLQRLRTPRALTFAQSVALQCHGLSALGLFWASLALPVAFLIGTGEDYRLAQFLAVGVGTAGGLAGLRRILAGYQRLAELAGSRTQSRFLLGYALLFAAVGGQLAWMLRPFIGSPSLGFQLLRPLEGNIVLHLLGLFGRH